jgi:hypothetical protein
MKVLFLILIFILTSCGGGATDNVNSIGREFVFSEESFTVNEKSYLDVVCSSLKDKKIRLDATFKTFDFEVKRKDCTGSEYSATAILKLKVVQSFTSFTKAPTNTSTVFISSYETDEQGSLASLCAQVSSTLVASYSRKSSEVVETYSISNRSCDGSDITKSCFIVATSVKGALNGQYKVIKQLSLSIDTDPSSTSLGHVTHREQLEECVDPEKEFSLTSDFTRHY